MKVVWCPIYVVYSKILSEDGLKSFSAFATSVCEHFMAGNVKCVDRTVGCRYFSAKCKRFCQSDCIGSLSAMSLCVL